MSLQVLKGKAGRSMFFGGSHHSSMIANISMSYPSASLAPGYGSYKHNNFVTGATKQTRRAISGVMVVQELERVCLRMPESPLSSSPSLLMKSIVLLWWMN
jgi:hypothetical protein